MSDTKANFPGKHPWQSTISEKVGRGAGAWVKNIFFFEKFCVRTKRMIPIGNVNIGTLFEAKLLKKTQLQD